MAVRAEENPSRLLSTPFSCSSQACNINTSLLTLGKVVSALAAGQAPGEIYGRRLIMVRAGAP